MGVERAVVRWYIQRQSLLHEIAQLETQLVQAQTLEQSSTMSVDITEQTIEVHMVEQSQNLTFTTDELLQQLEKARGKLKTLGPCPKPMMG